MADEKEFQIQRWVYCGRFEGHVRFSASNDNPGEGSTFNYKTTKFHGGVVGGLYEIEAKSDGGTARLGTAKYIGKIENVAHIVALEVKERAAHAVEACERRQAKDKADKEYFKALDPIRGLYQRSSWNEKRAIELCVLEYLRR